jgi:hypothetical protein
MEAGGTGDLDRSVLGATPLAATAPPRDLPPELVDERVPRAPLLFDIDAEGPLNTEHR